MRAVGSVVALVAALLLALPPWVGAQTTQELRERVKELEREVQSLKRAVEQPRPQPPTAAPGVTAEELRQLQEEVRGLRVGDLNFVVSGYAVATFQDEEEANSTFNASFNPVFLMSYKDLLLFEGELELELEDDETELSLEYAQLAAFVHDYVTVGAGKFLLPFDIFAERLHPAWINKLPTFPPAFQHHGGLAPFAEVGAQVRGGVPLGERARGNYAMYVSNGPRLVTSGHHVGELRFGEVDDVNANKAVGGRVGFLPFPSLEIGGSFMYTDDAAPDDFGSSVGARLFGADLSYVREYEALRGRIDLRSEFVYQDIDDATFTVEGAPFVFDNNQKWSAYGQLAYRPTLLEAPVLRDLEFVYRFSYLDWPEDDPNPGGTDWTQHAFGVNYWITPSAVLKAAYEINDKERIADENLFTLQLAWGF